MANAQKNAVFEVVLTVKEDGVALNISTATNLKIFLEKPDNTVIEKAASFVTDGSDGKLKCATTANEADQSGYWQAQADFTLGSFTGRTSKAGFIVENNVGE
jgi:BppU N-terminal domain